MDRIPITHATRIKSVGYDIPNHLLEVAFSDGSIREYRKVEQEVYERLMHADPLDDYFDANIAGKYEQANSEG